MSRKCSQIPDFESLSSELTGKPSCWKPKQMMKFLKYIKMEGLCDKFGKSSSNKNFKNYHRGSRNQWANFSRFEKRQ